MHIVPFQTVTHIPRLLCHKLCCWAQQLWCVCQWWWWWVQSTLCLLGEALKCLLVLLSTELKWDLMSISHCLAYIILTFFAEQEKEIRNWAALLPLFPYLSNLSFNLISSTVGSMLFPAEPHVSYCCSIFKELKNIFWCLKTSDISSSFPRLCW